MTHPKETFCDPAIVHALYTAMIGPVRERARELGYAITVHGSLRRDIDLVAVPWVPHAVEPQFLANALVNLIREVCGTAIVVNDPAARPGDWLNRNPEPKPHGRLAWSIYLVEAHVAPYVDLSIVSPR